jgi:hypothetical protein
MRESVDRRVLSAFRCVDHVTNKSILSTLAVEALPLIVRPNRSGTYVIFNVPGLDLLTSEFDPPPSEAAKFANGAKFEITVKDPSRRYLSRRAKIQTPQKLPPPEDPSQAFDPAAVLSDSLVVFNPQVVKLYSSPAAPIASNWAVIHASVIRSGVTPLQGLPWSVIQAVRTDDNTKILATTVTDDRGEGLLAIPGLGPEVSGSDTGAVTKATIGVTLNAWFDTNSKKEMIPNPDDILNILNTPQAASLKTGSLSFQIGPGQTVNRSLAISV